MRYIRNSSAKDSFHTRLFATPFFWFVLPINIITILFTLIPIFYTFYLSFLELSPLTPIEKAKFIGLSNYIKMIRDPFFSTALINSTIFTVTSIVFQNLIGLVAALAFAYAGVRGGKFIRPILFYPAILSPVIVGLLWTRILLSQGVLNQILRSVGLGFLQRDWLTDPSINIWVITGVSIWQWSGFNMTLYYAALKSIPQDFIDAGKIDGADDWNIIRRILIPLIKPTIIVAIVLNLIGGFKIFDLIYVMTCGGPFHASEVLSTYIYFNAFSDLGPADFGYGAAIGVILFIMILLPSILQMRWLYSQTIEY